MIQLFSIGNNLEFDYIESLVKPSLPSCFCEHFNKSVSRPIRQYLDIPIDIQKKLYSINKKILSFPSEYIPSIFEEEWVDLRNSILPHLPIPSDINLIPGMRLGPARYLIKSTKFPHFMVYGEDVMVSDHLYKLIKASNLNGYVFESVSLTVQRKKHTELNPPTYYLIKPISNLKYYTEIWDTCPLCGHSELSDIQDPVNEDEIWDGSDFVMHNERVHVSDRVVKYFSEWGIYDVYFKAIEENLAIINPSSPIAQPDIKMDKSLIFSIIPLLHYEAVKQQLADYKNTHRNNPLDLQPPVSLKKLNIKSEMLSGNNIGIQNAYSLKMISCFDIHLDLMHSTSVTSLSDIGEILQKIVGVAFQTEFKFPKLVYIIIGEGFFCQLREVFSYDGNLYQIVIWKQYNNPSTWDPVKAYQLCEKLSQAFLKATPCEVRIEGRGVRLLSVESSKVATVEVTAVEPDVATKISEGRIECFEMHIELEDNPPFPGVDDFLPIIQRVLGMDYRDESYMLDSFKYIFEGSKLCCVFNEDYDRPGMTFHLELCKQGSKRTKWEPLKVYRLCEEMCKSFLDVCPCEVNIVGRGIGFLSMQSSIASDED